MSIYQGNNLAYGLQNPLQGMNPANVYAQIAPNNIQKREYGTFWFYKQSSTETQLYVYVPSNEWNQFAFQSSAVSFSSITTNALTVSGGISTAPVNSSVATAAFVTTLTAGTSVQNTTGYDLMCNIVLVVASSTNATITLGVGAATGPTANTVYPTFTAVSSTMLSFSAIVPNNYYMVYNTTGTISVSSVTVQSCAL